MAIDYNQFYLSISRIFSSFRDDIGNNVEASGTSFWLFHKNTGILVTNRHMLDYSIHRETKFQLYKSRIWLRTKQANTLNDHPEEFEIDLAQSKIHFHDSADLVIIIPKFNSDKLWSHSINSERLANDDFFKKLMPSDSCVFIGYPSMKKSEPWWDTQSGLPIVRLANLASYPGKDFVNESIKSSHARLVAGLSFGGSSGSPVLNVGTQFSAGKGITLEGAIEPMIIGIMGGHWWDDSSEAPSILRHTGLSYFIASTAILELLEKI